MEAGKRRLAGDTARAATDVTPVFQPAATRDRPVFEPHPVFGPVFMRKPALFSSGQAYLP